ncbi:MAG: CPBP family intramembrane metalloprotease, partial [Ruminococcus sp.]|nr:CPBP family intramembrane metalloprotease [Ruminococcus sp.]
IVMMVFFVFDVVIYLIMAYMGYGEMCNVVYYSQRYQLNRGLPLLPVAVYTVLTVVKFITAISVFRLKTKVPLTVALPRTGAGFVVNFNSVAIMLMIMVVGLISNSLLDKILSVFHVDSVYIYMFPGSSTGVMVLSIILNCLILPVLTEVLFRGFVMQSFRQFGDSFAVIVSSLVCCLTFYDLSYIGYSLCCSIVIGLFTIRTGSLKTAVWMHVISTSVNYLLTLIGSYSSSAGRVLEIMVFLLICASALMVYSRLNNFKDWSYNIDHQSSEVTFDKKIEQIFSSNTIVLWFVLVIIMTIVGMKIL